MTRRRLFLLLALLPITLGVVTLTVMRAEPGTGYEDLERIPAMREAGSLPAHEAEPARPAATAPAEGRGIEVSTAPAIIRKPRAPERKPAEPPRAPAPQPTSTTPAASGEAAGPVLLADAGGSIRAPSAFTASWTSTRLGVVGTSGADDGAHGSSGSKAPEEHVDPVPGNDPGHGDDPGNSGSSNPNDGKHTDPHDAGGDPPDSKGPDSKGPHHETPDQNPPQQNPSDGGHDEPPPSYPDPTWPGATDPEEQSPVSVPEPGALGLLAVGLLGCMLRRRRR